MTCPKCDSSNVVSAPDEAPRATLEWMKCFACGKRWDQSGRMLRALNEEQELANGPIVEQPPVKRAGEDLVNVVMRVARTHPATQTKEKPMGAWSAEAREAHRKRMQEVWAQKREGGGATGKRKVGRPAKNAVAIRLTEAVPIKPLGGLDLNGNAYQILGAAIEQLEHDRLALERAREVLGRMA